MSFASELNRQRREIERFRNDHGPEKEWISNAIRIIKADATTINNFHRSPVLEGYFHRDSDGLWGIYKCDEANAMAAKSSKYSAPTKLIYLKDYVEDIDFIVNELNAQLTQLGFKNIRIKVFRPDLLGTESKVSWSILGNKKTSISTYVELHAYFKVLYLRVEW